MSLVQTVLRLIKNKSCLPNVLGTTYCVRTTHCPICMHAQMHLAKRGTVTLEGKAEETKGVSMV